jgi:hypothetical protein
MMGMPMMVKAVLVVAAASREIVSVARLPDFGLPERPSVDNTAQEYKDRTRRTDAAAINPRARLRQIFFIPLSLLILKRPF